MTYVNKHLWRRTLTQAGYRVDEEPDYYDPAWKHSATALPPGAPPRRPATPLPSPLDGAAAVVVPKPPPLPEVWRTGADGAAARPKPFAFVRRTVAEPVTIEDDSEDTDTDVRP